MFTSQRPTTPGNVAKELASKDGDSAVNYYVGRLIQIALALWLLPALIIVLAVGGIGILALAMSRTGFRSGMDKWNGQVKWTRIATRDRSILRDVYDGR